jgi:hypothetical protein
MFPPANVVARPMGAAGRAERSDTLAEVSRFAERSRAVFNTPGLRWGVVLMMMSAMTNFPMSAIRKARA